MTALVYIGLVLFLVGAWQAFRKGSHSAVIGGTLLVYALGAALALAGVRDFGESVVYLFVTFFLAMQLLKLSSRWNYYFHLIPFAVIFGAAIGYFADFFDVQRFFVAQLVLSVIFVAGTLTRQLTSRAAMKAYAKLEKAVVSSVAEAEVRRQLRKELRPKRLVVQHVTASAIAFALACGLTFYLVHGSL